MHAFSIFLRRQKQVTRSWGYMKCLWHSMVPSFVDHMMMGHLTGENNMVTYNMPIILSSGPWVHFRYIYSIILNLSALGSKNLFQKDDFYFHWVYQPSKTRSKPRKTIPHRKVSNHDLNEEIAQQGIFATTITQRGQHFFWCSDLLIMWNQGRNHQ